ncbi:RidA family protein [Mesorhizobium caraganae]|uniref:RidA family protein n=1 Tax=Mesorhizobium caraganae TaxID=483206 RepID=UPI00178196ED|nr:RidA family protein [Mesorhizobium caraganae]MBM2712944.1 RidA family protein [Mesorhizobium caraganae]
MITRYNSTKRLTSLLTANGFAFLSGLVPKNRSGGVREQTADVLDQIDTFLAEAGTDKSRIVVANIWLKDIGSFDEMNAAWDAWVPEGAAPARATVESRLAAPDILVEIQVQALL